MLIYILVIHMCEKITKYMHIKNILGPVFLCFALRKHKFESSYVYSTYCVLGQSSSL